MAETFQNYQEIGGSLTLASYAVPAGAAVLVVAVGQEGDLNGDLGDGQSCSFDGAAMTKLVDRQSHTSTAFQNHAALYELVNPSGTGNIVVAGLDNNTPRVSILAVSLFNVEAQTAEATGQNSSGSSGQSSLDVSYTPATANAVALGFISTGDSTSSHTPPTAWDELGEIDADNQTSAELAALADAGAVGAKTADFGFVSARRPTGLVGVWETAAGGTVFDESANLAVTAGVAGLAEASFEGAATLGLSSALSPVVAATFEASAALAVSAALAQAGGQTIEESAGLDLSTGVTGLFGLVIEESASLSLSAGVGTAAAATVEAAASLGLSCGLSAIGRLVMEESGQLGLTSGLGGLAAVVFEAAAGLDLLGSVDGEGGSIFEDTAGLGLSVGLTGLEGQVFEVAAGLGLVLGLATNEALTIDEAAGLAVGLGLEADAQSILDLAAGLGLTAGLSGEAAASYEAGGALGLSSALTTAATLTLEEAAGLALALSLSGAGAGGGADVPARQRIASEALRQVVATGLKRRMEVARGNRKGNR